MRRRLIGEHARRIGEADSPRSEENELYREFFEFILQFSHFVDEFEFECGAFFGPGLLFEASNLV